MIINKNGIQKTDINTYITSLIKVFKKHNQNISNASSSPQQGLIDVITQAKSDLDENMIALITQLGRGASGEFLDLQASYLNMKRKGASHTIVPLKVVANKDGVITNTNNVNGNQFLVNIGGYDFVPEDNYNIPEAGEYIKNFIAVDPGEIVITPNDAVIVKTPLSFISNVYNLYSPVSIGINGELDTSLRDRMDNSNSINSAGMPESIEAKIKQLDGVIDVKWFQNPTNDTDERGIPPRTLYFIVDGGKTNDIGEIICENIGNNLTKGDVVFSKDGREYRFDRSGIIDLFVDFQLKLFVADFTQDIVDNIKNKIVELSGEKNIFKIAKQTDINQIQTIALLALQELNIQGSIFNVKIGTNSEHIDQDIVANTTLKDKFALSSEHITITNYDEQR